MSIKTTGLQVVRGGLLVLFCLAGFSYGEDRVSSKIRSLAISPDGKLIAVEYAKGNTSFIYKVAVDTGIATRLTNAQTGQESSPDFSADGKRIAYSYSQGDRASSRIVIRGVDGSEFCSWLTADASDLLPVFSPDNQSVVFARSAYFGSYSPIAQPHPHSWSLYSGDLCGVNVHILTGESFYMASPPSVSPDGKSVAVVTEGIETNREISIFSVDHPGKVAQSLQPHVPGEADHKNPLLTFPNYLADGKSLLFMAASKGKLGRVYDYDIYRLDIMSGAIERLTTGNGFATNLKVSSNGTTAVFLKWQYDRHRTPVTSEPYLLDIQTHTITMLKITGLN